MKTYQEWLADYQVSHNNKLNKQIHNICVPVIMFTVLGLMWCLPTPESINQYPILNWSLLFAFITLIFYFILNKIIGLFMLLFSIINFVIIYWFDIVLEAPLLEISLGLFILAWIGQFIGHKIEGRKPSFFQDIQFLLIGPIWVLFPFIKKFLK